MKQYKKQTILLLFIAISLFFTTQQIVNAQMMQQTPSQGVTLSQEDQQDISTGQQLYNDLKNNKTSCNNLKDDDFDKIGEYIMEQQIGNSNRHAQMNAIMKQMMGENGEKQMHIGLGKRITGCDSNYYPNRRGGGYPMMGYGGNNMMGNWGVFGLFGSISMLLFWALLILAAFVLVRYLKGPDKNNYKEKTPLDILKERYAKGEIDKKEFEEKKKDMA